MGVWWFNLDPAVGRVRVGGEPWAGPGATRRRLNACNEEQRRPVHGSPLNRARSALTPLVTAFVKPKRKRHQALLASGKRLTAGSRFKARRGARRL
jgi:hypothetical protein